MKEIPLKRFCSSKGSLGGELLFKSVSLERNRFSKRFLLKGVPLNRSRLQAGSLGGEPLFKLVSLERSRSSKWLLWRGAAFELVPSKV